MRPWLVLIFLLMTHSALSAQSNSAGAAPDLNPELQRLAADFFSWRAKQQPASGEDISRVDRPAGWLPAWSREDLAVYRAKYPYYLEKLGALDRSGFSRADEVDAMLLASAIHRVGWELDVLAEPNRNPMFYVQQTLGSVFELLILSSPWTNERNAELLRRLQHFPVTLKHAEINLTKPVLPFALATIEGLMPIEQQLQAMQGLLSEWPEASVGDLEAATQTASQALVDYRLWLQKNLQSMYEESAIGAEAYQWFLANVGLIPYTPDELLAQGRQARSRAVTFAALQQNRHADTPELPLFSSAEEQIAVSTRNELEIRSFLENQRLITIPPSLQHYGNRLMPAWLEPLAWLGANNDLTSVNRLEENAFSYIREPAEDLPYFNLASARDPRPIIIHEGIPGHYFQLTQSWANPDPIRRQFFDAAANEGIGFYVEEMLLQAGLLDFSPRSQEILYSFMSFRALLLEVDIRLANGEFSIEQAAEYLEESVPMDRQSALQQVELFAQRPGQGISYQVGKLQIEKFLSDVRRETGEEFSLRGFHDALMRNGNVPIALQRWEVLDHDDEIQRLKSLTSQPPTVPY